MGEDTFRNLLHYPPKKLLGYEISEELKALLTLYANSRKALTPKQTARYLLRLAELTAQADAQARAAKQGISEETLIRNIANNKL